MEDVHAIGYRVEKCQKIRRGLATIAAKRMIGILRVAEIVDTSLHVQAYLTNYGKIFQNLSARDRLRSGAILLNISQFRSDIIRPTLERMDPIFRGEAAENLILGTICQESGFRHIKQLNGPALGLIQIEPDTLDDLYLNFLHYHKAWMLWLEGLRGLFPDKYSAIQGNLYYMTAVCRLQYYRFPFMMPDADDVEGLGIIWKKFWNTPKGRGTIPQFVLNYKEYVL